MMSTRLQEIFIALRLTHSMGYRSCPTLANFPIVLMNRHGLFRDTILSESNFYSCQSSCNNLSKHNCHGIFFKGFPVLRDNTVSIRILRHLHGADRNTLMFSQIATKFRDKHDRLVAQGEDDVTRSSRVLAREIARKRRRYGGFGDFDRKRERGSKTRA